MVKMIWYNAIYYIFWIIFWITAREYNWIDLHENFKCGNDKCQYIFSNGEKICRKFSMVDMTEYFAYKFGYIPLNYR